MWWLLVASAASASTFMPPKGTLIAGELDKLYAFLLISSAVVFVGLIAAMIYFVIKYRRRSGDDKTAYITHNHLAEFLWSFLPFCVFLFVFAWGWSIYHEMRTFPKDALEVHVMAKKWDWRFLYKNGKEVTSTVDANGQKQPPAMVVPVGRPVKVIMASEKVVVGSADASDRPVIHSFFVPAFRIKQDVVPGRYTAAWFQAEKPGDYWLFCAEFCGPGHSSMKGLIRAVPEAEFEKWLAAEATVGGSLADVGRGLYATKACVGCHSLDGTRIVGPSFKGVFGKTENLEGGSSVQVDENYIRESILTPTAKIVAGYQPAMPPYAGQLSEDEIKAIIEFIKSVK
jgi:cytochrome c oxidase subunit 2